MGSVFYTHNTQKQGALPALRPPLRPCLPFLVRLLEINREGPQKTPPGDSTGKAWGLDAAGTALSRRVSGRDVGEQYVGFLEVCTAVSVTCKNHASQPVSKQP